MDAGRVYASGAIDKDVHQRSRQRELLAFPLYSCRHMPPISVGVLLDIELQGIDHTLRSVYCCLFLGLEAQSKFVGGNWRFLQMNQM